MVKTEIYCLHEAQLTALVREHTNQGEKYVPSTVLALKMAKVFNIAVEEIFQLEEED